MRRGAGSRVRLGGALWRAGGKAVTSRVKVRACPPASTACGTRARTPTYLYSRPHPYRSAPLPPRRPTAPRGDIVVELALPLSGQARRVRERTSPRSPAPPRGRHIRVDRHLARRALSTLIALPVLCRVAHQAALDPRRLRVKACLRYRAQRVRDERRFAHGSQLQELRFHVERPVPHRACQQRFSYTSMSSHSILKCTYSGVVDGLGHQFCSF